MLTTLSNKRMIACALVLCAGILLAYFMLGRPNASSRTATQTTGHTSASSESPAIDPSIYIPEALPSNFVPEEVANGIPYKGMEAIYLSSTLLGKPDTVTVLSDHRNYAWYSDDAEFPDNIIVVLTVRDGVVSDLSVVEENLPEDVLAALNAGEQSNAGTTPGTQSRPTGTPRITDEKPDPNDYDFADDYADDASDWYRRNGSADPWNDAIDDWLDDVGEGGDDW